MIFGLRDDTLLVLVILHDHTLQIHISDDPYTSSLSYDTWFTARIPCRGVLLSFCGEFFLAYVHCYGWLPYLC